MSFFKIFVPLDLRSAILSLVFVLLTLPWLDAQSPSQDKALLESINQQYASVLALPESQQKEKLQGLIAQLVQVIERQEAPSSHLYYNLGTLYLKTENYGQAIFQLKKAYRLNPNDQRIVDHLNRALLQAKIDTNSKAELSLALWLQRFWGGLTVLQLQSLLLLLCFGSVLIFLIKGKRKPKWGVLLSFFILLMLILAWLRSENLGIQKEVILLAEQNPRAGLGLQYPGILADRAVLPSGSMGQLLREDSGWYEVLWGDKGRGWVPKSDAGLVY